MTPARADGSRATLFVALYGAAVIVVAALLALLRAGLLAWTAADPESHFGLAAGAHLALGSALGLATTPVALGAWLALRGRVHEPARFAAVAAAILVVLPLACLTSSLGFERPLGDEEPGAIVRGVAPWLACGAGLASFGWWLLSGRSAAAAWRRAAALVGLVLAIAASMHVQAAWRSPPSPSLAGGAARHPVDVFVVLVDTLRADHLSIYGYPLPTSPNVDAFAHDATLFTRAFAHAPWTRPSCASLLSGRYPPDTRVQTLYSALPEEIPILPQLLQAAGYETAGIVSSVQLSRQFGFAKGFDLHDIGSSYLLWTGLQRALARLELVGRNERYPRYDAAGLTDAAIEWLDERPPGAGPPVFMYLHYADPHGPYAPPPPSDRWRDFASARARALAEPPRLRPRGDAVYDDAEREAMIAAYDAEIAFFDDHFGRLLAYLRVTGRYDDALIVLTADHGEEFQEHGGWEHGRTLFNEQLHVPLIVKYPARLGRARGRRVSTRVGLVDVLPTVQQVVGADFGVAALRGDSLLDAEGAGDRTIYADTFFPDRPLRSLFLGSDKLIQTLDASGGVSGERLFSLDRDFAELDGASLDERDPARSELRERLAGLAAGAADIAAGPVDVELDAATRSELRALGYLK